MALTGCKHIFAVDTHTMGEPTRVVVGGLDLPPDGSVRQKKELFAAGMDHIRTALLCEPRGHGDMFGAVLLKPGDPAADLGVFFIDNGGYLDMCGHGIIGACVAAAEAGFIEPTEPLTRLTVETPAGLIGVEMAVTNGIICDVSVTNVDAFLYQTGIPVELGGLGRINVDISYGGNFFALLEAKELGLTVSMDNLGRLVEVGMAIKTAMADHPRPVHPNLGPLPVSLVEFCESVEENGISARNLVVFGQGQFDRSPCGTGTCAKMAALHAKGRLALGQPFVHQSIIGTTFRGMLEAESRLGGQPAVVPRITARAYVTGMQNFVLNPEDPLCNGFHINHAAPGGA